MAKKPSGKILRIGILQGGRIIEERYMRKRETITIGESPKSSFIIPLSDKPIPKCFPIFPYKGHQYEVVFTESMTGKITLDGKVIDLKDLSKDKRVKKKGSAYHLTMSDTMRGKLTLGEVSVLFNFVQAPPLPAKPKLPASIRQGWLKSIDWVYVTILFCSFLLEASVFGYASTQPIPKKAAIEAMPERFAKIIVTDLPDLKKEDKKPKDGEGQGKAKKKKKKAKKAEPTEQKAEAKPQMSDRDRAEAAAKRKAEIAKKVAGLGLNAIIGAKGAGGSNMLGNLADTLGEGGRFGNIEDVMQGVTGLGIAKRSTERGRRGGGGGGPASKNIEKVGVGKGTNANLSGRKEKAVKASAKVGSVDVDGTLDGAAVKRVIKRNLPSVRHCYEQELRRNPKLAGKVTLEIVISGRGTVKEANVVGTSLNNKAVESCITRTIKRWRFPSSEDETIIEYPFIFIGVR